MSEKWDRNQLSPRDIEWMLSSGTELSEGEPQPYGDLTALNSGGLINSSVGPEVLSNIVADFVSLLGTSSAIYEKNGDYAFGIFSSGWCRSLDLASFRLCNTDDMDQALRCGKWLCHESCWTDASKVCIERDEKTTIQCHGGLHIYAIPIHVDGEIVGAINVGYGNPPNDEAQLREIADKYAVPYESLVKNAQEYLHRPVYLVELAKKRLQSAASLIGSLVERHKAQEQLRESEERYRNLQQSMIQPMALHEIICDTAGTPVDYRFLSVNSAFEQLLDKKAEEIVGRTVLEVLPGTESSWIEAYGKVALQRTPLHFENYSQALDRHFDIVAFSPAVGQFVVIATDITERVKMVEEKKQLERQMFHTQKLESLGVLAGGIAHDFNNILAAIIGYCGLTKMNYETAEKNIPEIEKAAERAAGLCQQMMAYAGKAQITKTKVNMVTKVDDIVNMLKSTLPQNAAIKTDLSAKIPLIECDASQLRQVVMNLIINASEAIGTEHGEVNVSLARIKVESGKSYEDYHGKAIPPGEYVCLEVTDNGCGMDEATKWRIFEPFYTTKFTGRGLGMSAVLGIIKSHAGALQLFSQPSQGTTFKVYLPALTSETDRDEVQAVSVPATPWQGSGTILLAEDEAQVRYIAKEMLQMFGFTVLEAVNGKEALEIYLKNTAVITLVVTDMGMPVMDGYELIHKLKILNPELSIIVSSGYGDADVTSRIRSDNIAGIINKPYNMNQLQEVLKSAVEGTASTKA